MSTSVIKHIVVISATVCIALNGYSQECYYYCNGEKIPLMENTDKIVMVSLENQTKEAHSQYLTLIDTMEDGWGTVRVYYVAPASYAAVRKAMSISTATMPCYSCSGVGELVPDGYINVKLNNSSDYPDLKIAAKKYGCEVVRQNPFMPLWYDLHINMLPGQNSVEIANSLYETGLFAESSPSFTFDAADISYDPEIKNQWGLYNHEYEDVDISVGQAWDYSTGRGIKIAIVDTGIDLQHVDLADNIYPLSYDTETGEEQSQVYRDHGTHCAGIAAAVRNNGILVAGVAPDAYLMSVSNRLYGLNSESKRADGINWAWQNGADIISCSWYAKKNEMITDAIDNAVTKGRNGKGCVFVNSAGNASSHPLGSETFPLTFPADYGEDVIAVSNLSWTGILSPESCYGENLLVCAPGDSILSTVPNNRIGKKTGTSMACPHVAGVAALILERNPNLTAKEVREIIARNAKKVGPEPYSIVKQYGTWNEKYGYGLVDAYKAVLNTPPSKTTIITP